MNRAIGLDPEVELKIDASLALPSKVAIPPLEILLEGLEDRRLDLIALRRGYDSQEETLCAAILAQFPKINFGLNKVRDNTNVKSIGFSLAVDLPVLDHNQGEIAAQTATRQMLFDEYAQRRFEARSDVIGAMDDIRAVEDLLAAAEKDVPAQQKLVDAYRTALDRGNLDVLSYYTAISDLQQKKLNVIKLQQQLMENRVAIEIASGEYLPDATASAPPTSCARRNCDENCREMDHPRFPGTRVGAAGYWYARIIAPQPALRRRTQPPTRSSRSSPFALSPSEVERSTPPSVLSVRFSPSPAM